jgi:hypothetical protein
MSSTKIPLWKQRQLAEEKRIAAIKLAEQEAKLNKLKELGLIRPRSTEAQAQEGVPNPSAIDADTGKTLRRNANSRIQSRFEE